MLTETHKQKVLQGEALFLEGQYQQALALFEDVLDDGVEETHVLNDAGLARSEIGDVMKAAEYFERALTARPENANAFFNFLDLLLAEDKIEAAVQVLFQHEEHIAESEEKLQYAERILEQVSREPHEATMPREKQEASPGVTVIDRADTTKKRHIVIVSQPRSGTTVLWNTLRQDPRLRCYDEPFRPHLRRYVEAGADDKKETMGEFLAEADLIRQHWSTVRPYEEAYPAFIGHQVHYLQALLNTHDHVCMDFVRCSTRIAHLREIAPDALIVHLVRDPRSWVTSHLRPYGDWLPGLPEQFFTYDGWFNFWSRQDLAQALGLEGFAYEQLLQIWNHLVTAAEQASPDVTIQFEHFATHPGEVMQAIYNRTVLDYRELDFAALHPPHLPHRHEDARWQAALRQHIRDEHQQFVYDFQESEAPSLQFAG